jgi:hypothetical protein
MLQSKSTWRNLWMKPLPNLIKEQTPIQNQRGKGREGEGEVQKERTNVLPRASTQKHKCANGSHKEKWRPIKGDQNK